MYVQHTMSSAYYVQSQDALKSMKLLWHSYGLELNTDRKEGLPWILSGARRVVEESTGFNLIFL